MLLSVAGGWSAETGFAAESALAESEEFWDLVDVAASGTGLSVAPLVSGSAPSAVQTNQLSANTAFSLFLEDHLGASD